MRKRVLLVRHGDDPMDDRVTTFCQLNGLRPDTRRPCLGDSLGEVTEDLAGVVVFGGIYNAYDVKKHPFLADEYSIMTRAIDAGIPVLGLCQGAQMLAHLHGSFAGAPEHGQHEFGYYEITPTPEGRSFLPGPLHVSQWHFHTFDLPDDAVHLARSEMFENQAFAIGDRIVGLQFHPEQTVEGFRRWQDMGTDSYTQPGAQSREEQTILMHQHDGAQARWFYDFLGGFFGTGAV